MGCVSNYQSQSLVRGKRALVGCGDLGFGGERRMSARARATRAGRGKPSVFTRSIEGTKSIVTRYRLFAATAAAAAALAAPSASCCCATSFRYEGLKLQ